MARPERNNIDYFPFMCKEGKTMYCIETKYGNDGYATWIKILRLLAVTNYHYLNLSDKTELMFVASKCNITEEKLIEIINDLCELKQFDSILWNENKIIWSQDFIDSIQDAYKKRNNKCITYEGLVTLLIGLGVRKPTSKEIKVPVKPQSKVEYSKVKESTYTKEVFIEDWNVLRIEYLKKPSFLNQISFQDSSLFNDLIKNYTRDDFKYALTGLFKQKKLPNDSTSMQSNPSHFLRFFNSYLTAYYDTNDKLYGKQE